MPRSRKAPSLGSICGQESVMMLIQLMKKHPELYSVSTSVPDTLPPHCKDIFETILERLSERFRYAQLTKYLVWRCWYNLRSTYMRGTASTKWAPQLSFLKGCKDEYRKKNRMRSGFRERSMDSHVSVEDYNLSPAQTSIAEMETPQTVIQNAECNFFEEQFREDWTKIARSRGASAHLRNVRNSIIEIVSMVCDEFEAQQAASR